MKLFAQDGELYVLAKSEGRQAKEIAMRRKKLARLLRKLRAMRRSCPKRDQLLMRVGAAKTDAGRAFGFVKINLPQAGQEVTKETFTFQLDKAKLKEAELRDGHYLLRTNLVAEDPAVLWDRYVQLTQIEAAGNFGLSTTQFPHLICYRPIENQNVPMMFLVAKLPFPRGSGSHSLKQWAAGAPVIGAAPVSSGKPKRPRVEGLPASGALQLFLIEKEKRNEERTRETKTKHKQNKAPDPPNGFVFSNRPGQRQATQLTPRPAASGTPELSSMTHNPQPPVCQTINRSRVRSAKTKTRPGNTTQSE